MKRLIIIISLSLFVTGCGLWGNENSKSIEVQKSPSPITQQDSKPTPEIQTGNTEVTSSEIKWIGYKVAGSQSGTIALKSADLKIENEQLIGGVFVLDMKSIDHDGGSKRLIDHLKNEDFFNTAQHQEASFEISSVSPISFSEDDTNFMVKGRLTIKSITHDIDFPAFIEQTKNTVTVSADFTFDRTKWDITYNSGNFFQDLGDNLIKDDVGIEMNVVFEVK